jgi:hemin uptake protein HemP
LETSDPVACSSQALLLRLSLITILRTGFFAKSVAKNKLPSDRLALGNEGFKKMPKANQSASSNPDQPREEPVSDAAFPKDKTPEGIPESSAVKFLPKIIPFRDLCRCGDEVWIEHEGQLYRLRCTKQGKLLLTK